MTKRIVVVASGRGSNFQAMIGALQRGSIPAECVALVTDNPKAYAIERAAGRSIPVVVVDYGSFASRELYEQALLRGAQGCPTRPCRACRVHAYSRIGDCPGVCRKDDEHPPGACCPVSPASMPSGRHSITG